MCVTELVSFDFNVFLCRLNYCPLLTYGLKIDLKINGNKKALSFERACVSLKTKILVAFNSFLDCISSVFGRLFNSIASIFQSLAGSVNCIFH